jgi:hypothetical protein
VRRFFICTFAALTAIAHPRRAPDISVSNHGDVS